jgi:peptide/nickel transport system substrate-binding protein
MGAIVLTLLVLLLAGPAAVSAAPAGTVVVAQGVDPTTLDPHNHQETPANNLAVNIFDTLLERDASLKIVPGLAAELPKLVSPTSWEFKLRRGVTFHNGEPFDAQSVKFSIERIANPALKLRGASPYAPLKDVTIVDSHTVRINTKAPWPILDTLMTTLMMLPPKYYGEKEMAHVQRSPVGSGPFKFVRWVKDDRIELEANDTYWRGAPKIKSLIFRPIPDDAVRVAALQNGEIDVAVNIPPHLAAIIEKHPRIFLSTAPSVRTIQLMIYTHQFDAQHKLQGPYPGPVADKRVRQALAHALDVDAIVKEVLDGKGVRVATMLTRDHFGFDPQLKPIKQDVARSKKLLADAGFPNGIDLVVNSPQGRYVRDKEVAEAAVGQLNKAGIRATLKAHEWGNYLNNMVYVHKAGPVWLIGWGTTSYDAETVYVPLFRSGKILSNYHNAEFDRMVDEAQTIMDAKKRLEQYHRINKLWLDDMPAIPLYQQLDLYGANKRLAWKARGDERIKGFEMAVKDGK